MILSIAYIFRISYNTARFNHLCKQYLRCPPPWALRLLWPGMSWILASRVWLYTCIVLGGEGC